MDKDYCHSYMALSGHERTFTYRTRLSSYEEGLVDGIYYSMGWLGSGYVPEQITQGSVPRLDYSKFAQGTAFKINIDGQDLVSHFSFLDYQKEETEKGLLVTVSLFHELTKVKVLIRTLLDGTSIITRWLEIENMSDKTIFITELTILGGGLQVTARCKSFVGEGESLYRLGYMKHTNWGLEGSFCFCDLPENTYTIKGKFARDRFRHPFFILENKGTGEHFVCQLAYSGGWKFDFDQELEAFAFDGEGSCKLSFNLSLDGFAPLIDLPKGETLISPSVHIGMVYGGLDACVNDMNDHIRKSVMRRQDNWNCPIECGLGPEMDMEEDALLRSIDYAGKHKLEYYIIDAGWFKPRKEDNWGPYIGEWFPKEERYEMGLLKIRDLCYEKGMKFGLWIEVERVLEQAQIYKNNKDFLANTYRTPIGENPDSPGPLDLSKDFVASWVEDTLRKLIDEYRLDLVRLDHNDYRKSYYLSEGRLVNSELRYNLNLYKIFDRLREDYPNVIFENCASGGGRTDLGMMGRMSHTWVTDWQRAPRSFAIMNGMSMALPIEYQDRIIGAQSGHLIGDFRFQSRLLLFGRPTINASTVCGFEENPIQGQILDHILDIYRDHVRPFIKESIIYHHTPILDLLEPKGQGIIELGAKDKSSALVGIFNLSKPQEEDLVFYFKSLDISRTYQLTMDNLASYTIVSGYSLMNEGVRVKLRGALDSELLIVKEVLDDISQVHMGPYKG